MYDGEWVKLVKWDLIDNFKGAHIIADTHYETANKTFKVVNGERDVKFYTPVAKPRGGKRKVDPHLPPDLSQGAAVLTEEQEKWNKNVSHL